jgi:hypothetical protein
MTVIFRKFRLLTGVPVPVYNAWSINKIENLKKIYQEIPRNVFPRKSTKTFNFNPILFFRKIVIHKPGPPVFPVASLFLMLLENTRPLPVGKEIHEISVADPGCFIPHPSICSSRIPDLGSRILVLCKKKGIRDEFLPDPGSGSATLHEMNNCFVDISTNVQTLRR